MHTELFVLNPAQVMHLWGTIRPMLSKAFEFGCGETDVDDVPQLVRDGNMAICALFEGDRVILTLALEVIRYPRKNVLNISYCAGRGVKQLVDNHWAQIEGMARKMDCSDIQTWCRDSAAKLFLAAQPNAKKAYNVLRIGVSNES